jgi:MFS family permease
VPNLLKISSISNLPTFTALYHKDYLNLWTGSTFAGMAIWTMIVGRGWLAFHLSDSSSVMVGWVTFAAMVPSIFLTPVGGFLADRFDRRRLVLIGYTINLLQATLLTILISLDLIQIWHLVFFAFVSGISRSISMPALTAMVPNLVPSKDLLNAIALSGIANHSSRLGGPGLATPLLAIVGVGGAFVLGAVLYVMAIFFVLRVQTVSTGGIKANTGILQSFQEGLVYCYSHAAVGILIILVALHCSLTMSFESMLPLFSQDELNSGVETFSSIIMATGGGALIGVLALASIKNHKNIGWLLLLTGLASGITPIALAISPTLPLAIVASVFMGGAHAVFMAITNTLVQDAVEDHIRGRVSSIYAMHAIGTMAFANLANGYLAEEWGSPIIFIVTASIFLSFLFLLSTFGSILRQIYRNGTAKPLMA